MGTIIEWSIPLQGIPSATWSSFCLVQWGNGTPNPRIFVLGRRLIEIRVPHVVNAYIGVHGEGQVSLL